MEENHLTLGKESCHKAQPTQSQDQRSVKKQHLQDYLFPKQKHKQTVIFVSFRTVPEHTTHQCTIHYMPLGRQFGVGYIDSLLVLLHLGRHLLCAICLRCSRPRRTCGEKSLPLLQLSRGLDRLNRLSPGLQEKIVADMLPRAWEIRRDIVIL